MLWSSCSRVFYVLSPVYTNNFCVTIFSWQFLFVRVHGRICQFFMWQMHLLKNWHASFYVQIIFVKYQHLFVCMTRHIYMWQIQIVLRLRTVFWEVDPVSARTSKERSMRPARWSSYRWKAGVPLFNATDRPQIQQLFAVSSTPRKDVSTKNCHTKIARVNRALILHWKCISYLHLWTTLFI